MAEIKWIKITTNMFDDEKIQLIDAMPERDTIFYIWIRLLVQAGKTNAGGYIFLSEKVPYTDEMLSTIFRRPLNSVRLALKTLNDFGMIQISEEHFIKITNWEKHQNVDEMDKIREQTRERVAKHRAKQKEIEAPAKNEVLPCNDERNVTVTLRNDIEEEVEEDKEKEKDNTTTATDAKVPSEMRDESFKRVMKEFEQCMYPPGGHEGEEISKWLDDIESDAIIIAIHEACEHNAKTLAYLESIIRNWFAKGLKTKAQVEHYQQEWQKKKRPYSTYKKPIPGAASNQRQYDANKLEEQLLARGNG